MLHSFYKHYFLYTYAFMPNTDVEIRTFEMFKSRFPFTDTLIDAEEKNPEDF